MLKSLYRQRRRIAVLALALVYAMWAQEGGIEGVRHALKHDFHGSITIFLVSFGLAAAIVATGLGVVLTYLFPNLRRSVEAFAIALVISDQILHLDAIMPAWTADGFGRWAVFFICYSLVAGLLENNLLYRIGIRLPLELVVKRTIRAAPKAIWAAVAPDAATLNADARRHINRIEPRPELGRDTYEVQYKMPGGLVLAQFHEREVWSYPNHLRYRFARAGGAEAGGTSTGQYAMDCCERPDGRTDVTITHRYPALSPGTWLLMWLDDAGRCEMDSIQARVEGRRDWSTHGWVLRQVARA